MKKKTMDLILILVGGSVVVFTIVMIWLCTGECGFMGWIKTAKTRYQDHEWQEQFEERQRELMEKERELEEARTHDGTTSD